MLSPVVVMRVLFVSNYSNTYIYQLCLCVWSVILCGIAVGCVGCDIAV